MKKLWQKGRSIWKEFSAITPSTHASSISYYTFLSLVPLLVICISLVSITGIDEETIIAFFKQFIPDVFYDLLEAIIDDAYKQSGIAFSLSSITLLWSASKGARALRVGLNAAYAKKEERSAPQLVAISFAAILVLGVLIAALLYLVFGDSILQFLISLIPNLQDHDDVMSFLYFVIIFVAAIFAIAACYAFLPVGKRRLLTQLPGAICATIACGLLSFGFKIYVENFSNYTVVYGSIATVAMLLFWMYLTFYILLVGGFINYYLQKIGQQDVAASPTYP